MAGGHPHPVASNSRTPTPPQTRSPCRRAGGRGCADEAGLAPQHAGVLLEVAIGPIALSSQLLLAEELVAEHALHAPCVVCHDLLLFLQSSLSGSRGALSMCAPGRHA
eukprot:scaffold2384_cov120-Isochrysis_galbana.AAC.4